MEKIVVNVMVKKNYSVSFFPSHAKLLAKLYTHFQNNLKPKQTSETLIDLNLLIN